MADIAGILGSSLKDKVLGVAKTQKVVKENPNTLLKIVGKNFMSLPGFARDLNVARQNIQKLVKLEGGEPAKGADAQFLKEGERAKKLDVEIGKDEKKKPTAMPGVNRVKKLKETFSKNKILKSVMKYLGLAAIVGVVFLAFKDTFVEWATGLWDAIKTKMGEFVDGIKEWFKESIQPIIDKVMEFIQPVIDTISGFFSKVGDFFIGYFNFWKNLITSPIQTIKNLYDGFMNKVNGLIDMLPNWVKEKLGIRKKGESAQVDDSAERKKLERQQSEPERKKQEAQREAEETERVKRLEKEKQYTGDDEIVRQRLGLPPKTETMRREEEAKKKEAIQPAPTPEALVVPGPAPAAPPPPTTPSAAAPKPTPKAAAPAAPSPEAKPPTSADVKPGKIGSESGKKAMLKAMDDANITDPNARAAIMAQVGHESGNFTMLSENLNYKAGTLMKLFPKKFSGPQDAEAVAAGGPQKVAERLYGGRMGNAPEGGGEGFMYRGRGFIQLTGKQNYTKFGYSSNPDDVSKPEAAADTAIKYMKQYKGDWTDIKAVTKFVNGGFIGLEDRAKHFQEYLNDPKITQVGAAASAPSGGGMASASSSLAQGQREQQKPQTPVVVNAPTNNTTIVNKTQVASSKRQDTGNMLASAAA
jgi:putative chitinase